MRRRRVLVNVSLAAIHREPAHASERVTEARMGERPTVLSEVDDGRWLQVRLEDGYTGWLRSWLAESDDPSWPGPRVAEIDVPFTWVRSQPGEDEEPVSDVLIGTRLASSGRPIGGWAPVRLPDGRKGFVRGAELLRGRPGAVTAARRPATVSALLATARRFAGVPYVWGGKSPKGFDCSGLTQCVHELHGLELPRDAKDQETWLGRRSRVLRDPMGIPPGGLVFFGPAGRPASHVGFSLGNGVFWHAQGRVRENSLEPGRSNYHEDLGLMFRRGFPPHPGVRIGR